MVSNLPSEIIKIIESYLGKKSEILIFEGKQPLILRLYDISLLNLHAYNFDRSYLSKNIKIVLLLEKGFNDIDWRLLSKNPIIYTIYYNFLKTRLKDSFFYELMMNRYNPRNSDKWTGWGLDIF